MADKKPLIDTNLFAKTSPDDQAPPRRRRDKNNPIVSKGVGLRADTWAKFSDIAAQLGTGYHDLAVWVLQDFIARWEAGYRPPTETKTVLKR